MVQVMWCGRTRHIIGVAAGIHSQGREEDEEDAPHPVSIGSMVPHQITGIKGFKNTKESDAPAHTSYACMILE